jgi:hypothetical protein
MITDHDILRQEDGTISGMLPNATLPRGFAMNVASTDPDTGLRTLQVASGRADGLLSRDVQQFAGLTDSQQLMLSVGIVMGLETPFEATKAGSIEDIDAVLEFECEDFMIELADGTRKLAVGTTLGSPCTFLAGKVCLAVSGDFAQYKISATLTPRTPGKVRLRFVKISGYIVA